MTADKWPSNPADWPHTPPLHVYRDLEREDRNLFWRMDSGHAANLLDEALDVLRLITEAIGSYDLGQQDSDYTLSVIGEIVDGTWAR